MSKKSLIKRLVNELEIEKIDFSSNENLPLEYYELKELAKSRVLLKSSLKIHVIIYIIVNFFLIIVNLYINTSEIENIFDLWFTFVLIGWGFFLWAHSIIVLTMNVYNLEKRIFIITISILTYLIVLLIFINYLINEIKEITVSWWPWPLVAIILFSGIYAFFVFENDDTSKLEIRIGKEIKKMKAEENAKQEKND